MRERVAILLFVAGLVGSAEPRRAVLACEQARARVVILDPEIDWGDAGALLWEWKAAEDPVIPEAHRKWFSHPSDAKPAEGGRVLTVASGGGVAVLSIEKREVIAYGRAGSNPHSVAELPGGYLLTASSTDDTLQLFPPAENGCLKGVQDLGLIDAHGLVWDEERGGVWALGGKRMKFLEFDRKGGRLEETKRMDLPVTERSRAYPRHGGHDLVWDADGRNLLLSDMDDLWRFDPKDGTFASLVSGPMTKVKSLAPDAGRRRFLLMQASENWWADTVRSLEGGRSWTLPGARFYKARWIDFQPNR